jgi:hypothetical protein
MPNRTSCRAQRDQRQDHGQQTGESGGTGRRKPDEASATPLVLAALDFDPQQEVTAACVRHSANIAELVGGGFGLSQPLALSGEAGLGLGGELVVASGLGATEPSLEFADRLAQPDDQR